LLFNQSKFLSAPPVGQFLVGANNPEKEARRVAAVHAALQRDKRWMKGAAGGHISLEGLRARSQNSLKSGAYMAAVRLACSYTNRIFSLQLEP
jgi:hypothetical protein